MGVPMKAFFRKTGRVIAGALLSFCTLFILVLIAAQIVLAVGINIMGSGKGTSFVQDKANAALSGSGYSVAFSGFYYDPLRGVTLHDLSVADGQGPFLSLDRFSLSVSLSQLALRDLSLLGRGGHLKLLRIPEGGKEDGEEPVVEPGGMKPFSLPDIYFRTISLEGLSLDSVEIAKNQADERPFIFSPALSAYARLGEDVSLRLRFRPGMEPLAPGVPAPDEISLDAGFSPASLRLALNRLEAVSSAYSLKAGGGADLSGAGSIDLSARVDYGDLGPATGGNFEKASMDLSATGPARSPAVAVNGLAVPGALLKERGLSDIALSLITEYAQEGADGKLEIRSAFREQPVTLAGEVFYAGAVFSVKNLKGTAPRIDLEGKGQYKEHFDGHLKISVSDLSYYKDLSGLDIAGTAEASARFSPAEAGQSAQVALSLAGSRYEGMSVKKLTAEASLPTLAVPWPESAKLDAQGLRLSPTVILHTLGVSLAAAGADADGESYALSFKGSGEAPSPVSFDGRAALSGLTEKIPVARDIRTTLKSGGSSIVLSGAFSPEEIDLKASTDRFRAGDVPAALPEALAGALINGTIHMKGPPAAPQTDLSASLTGLGAGEYKDAALTIGARHGDGRLSATLSGKGTGIRNLKADADLPLAFSLLPFAFTLEESAPLAGTMAADIDLAAISALFLPPAQDLSGDLSMNGRLGGTLGSPAPAGTIRLSGAAFEDSANGIELADLAAEAGFSSDRLDLKSLTATDGANGRLSGGGTLAFGEKSGADIALRAQDFNIPKTDLANGIIDAELFLKGASGGFNLTGTVDIAEMNVLIPETFQSRIPELNIVERAAEKKSAAAGALALDIKINAHNQVFVRGWGLDAEFSGDIDVSGSADKPQLNGTLSARRGRFEEFGKRFDLARAELRFQGEVPPSPYLDIEATTPAGDVTAAILLTGPVKAPAIKFASTPALPEDEVLSRILFGKDTARISPFQAVQLAQTARRFSGKGGGGGLDPLGMLRAATGLDDISVETDESGGANVGVGKYLTDNVYLELEKGKAENSGAATIKIEITPSINVESRTGQDAQTGGGVFWKRDY